MSNSREMIAGRWWRSDSPEKKLSGVLMQTDDNAWILQLEGTFEELPVPKKSGQPVEISMRLPEPIPVLTGFTTSGRRVSLVECFPLRSILPIVGNGSLELRPTLIIYDVHFETADDFKLKSLSIHCSNLDRWLATSGFALEPGTQLYPLSLTYSIPSSIDVPLDNGVGIGFSFSGRGPSFPVFSEVRITQQSWIRARSDQPRPFESLWPMLIDLTNLIALACGQPVRPLEIRATCEVVNSPDGKPYSIELIDNRPQIVGSPQEAAAHDMLFTFADVKEQFDKIVKAWFGRDAKIQSLYDLYFGTLHSNSMYVEHRFLNMFQALESFDRRSFVPAVEQMERHQERLIRVLGAVEEGDKKWLVGKLRHSHEPAAADRLRRLVKDLNAAWLVSESDITSAGDLRNYYTHFDPEVEKRLSSMDERGKATYNLSVRLQLLCELVLLGAAGLTTQDMTERMQRTHRLERRLVK